MEIAREPSSIGPVCDSIAQTKRELHGCGSTPKTKVASTDLGKQSYLLRTRGKLPLVLPLAVKANSVN